MDEYSRSTIHKSIQGCILVIMNALAICGNIFVCWAVYRKRKNLIVPYLYVLALAVSDLMVAICCFPFCIQAFLEDGWIHGHDLCQFNGFLLFYWGGISAPMLALTAVNRYFRMVKAHIYPNYFTIKSSVFMIVAVWVFTIFDGFLSTFVGPVIYEYDPRFFFCTGTFSSKTHEKNPIRACARILLSDLTQSRSQSFVPLDQRSENESSGSIHFEITMGNNRILVIRFTAQSQSTSISCYGACLKWLLQELQSRSQSPRYPGQG